MPLPTRARGVCPLVARAVFVGAVALAIALPKSVAAAELPGGALAVNRAAGAEACPDSNALAAELSRHIGPQKTETVPLVFSIDLARDGDELVATVRVTGRKQGERTLRAHGPTCDALHDALVVTLLVLLDEDPKAPAPAAAPAGTLAAPLPATPLWSPPAPAPSVPPPLPPLPEMDVPPRSERKRIPSLWLSGGGGVTHGIPLAWSGILLFELAGRLDAFELSAGAFWAPSRRFTERPGEVSVDAIGGHARACYAVSLLRGRDLRVLGCANGALAQLDGNSTGFETPHSIGRPWWLVGASAEATYPLSSRFDVGISVAALASPHREVFSVRGLAPSSVYATDPVVGILSARLEARLF